MVWLQTNPLYATAVALSVVHTDDAPTRWTPVLFFLLTEKRIHPLILEEPQILNHTHIEPFSVALVKLPQVLAGELITLKAELNLPLSEACAVSHYEGAVLSGWPTPTAWLASLLAVHPVSEIGYADGAVRTTASYKF